MSSNTVRKILNLIICGCAAAIATASFAQTPDVPVCRRLKYTAYSADGNASYSETVSSCTSNDTTYVYVSRMDCDTASFGKPERIIHGRRLTIPIRDKIVELSAALTETFREEEPEKRMDFQMEEVSGDNFCIPLEAAEGDIIPECRVSCRMGINSPDGRSFSIPPVSITMKGTVLSPQRIATPAGDFNCMAVRITLKMSMSIISSTEHMVMYIVPETGMVVREESVTRKGKVTEYTVLESIE